ncbi:HEAT repeat domain-containing protein [Luteolibacter sp. AS25]|uniref:HEAT repeat domain-containing protein n=1 Tax=Luteolibacter sp. AS25 TaxID=3135776 RepID=UPI00398B53E0
MPEDPKSPKNLSIRCPECRQQFDVDESLRGRTVECGSCDTRFRIDDHVVARAKKMYPGERQAPMLDRFQRVPRSTNSAPVNMQPMRYGDFKHPEQLGPTSPQRILAGFVGVAIMALTALLLIFSSNPNGAFYDIGTINKLVVACFVSMLGTVLLYYANPGGRMKALLIGLLVSAGLLSLPFFFKSGPEIGNEARNSGSPKESEKPVFAEIEADPIQELRENFGTAPLEKEQERLKETDKGTNAFGVYLTNMVDRNRYTSRDFLIRETEADLSSHPYPRDSGEYLMVLTDVAKTFEEVTKIAEQLGELEATHPEIGVVSIRVENEQFLAGSAEKLNDRDDPAFYELNIRELRSIDIDRVERAVIRLADAPPVIYRGDITRILHELLLKPRINFDLDISRALLKWTENPEKSSQVAIELIKRHIAEEQTPSEPLVELAVLSKSPDAIQPIHDIWVNSPNLWDKYLIQLGPEVVPLVLQQLTSDQAPLKRSAIKILGEVGGDESIPVLKELLRSEDPEIRMLSERSISDINAR